MASDDAHEAKWDQKKTLTDGSSTTNYGACLPNTEGQQEVEGKLEPSRRSSLWLVGRKMAKDNVVAESENQAEDQVQVESSHSSLEEKAKEKKDGKKEEGPSRTKSNQRWMKLRTTVQLSGAISSTIQKSKAPLKREDSFLKRFSTRQIPDVQETLDTGDETDASNGLQDQDELWRRRLRRRRQSSRFVVNPDENFYFYWLMLVTVCVLYNLWTTIVRQSFPELQALQPTFWFTCDGTTDVVFILDVLIQFRTGYLEQGLMVYDWKKLAGHYTKSRDFLFDILALLPLDVLQIFLGMFPILRFPRFLKTYRVCDYYYMVESRTVYPNVWRVVNLVHILLILAHWFGCFYFLISEAEGFKGDWVYPYQPGDYSTLSRKYLGSLYWSTLTLTTIGDLPTPETNTEHELISGDDLTINRTLLLLRMGLRNKSTPESRAARAGLPRRGHKSRILHCRSNRRYVFTIVSYLIGVFIFATIVGQVGNVITNRNANRLEFERLLDGAKTYMRHHKVPGGMKRRVLRWYDYSWSRGRIQGGGDINTALGLLPDKLKTELALHVNLSVLKKVTIFQECQPEFLHDLVLKMKAYIFTPGDLICRKGEVAREMFIIADGILDVISESGRVLTTMKAGDFFGEIGILNLDGLNKRTADVRSVGYSELFSLSREDVLTAMKDYPEAEQILQTLGRKRLMEARNASKLYKAKDQGPSLDNDATGKKIVDKLRSDVKGLKNALRKSRRGNRSKDKQNVLTRMSHVQSSDDDEPPEPIGQGLPLLQRLKLLKEKERKEKADPVAGPSSAIEYVQSQKAVSTLMRRKPKGGAEMTQVITTAPAPHDQAEIMTITVRTQQTSSAVNKCKTVALDANVEIKEEPSTSKEKSSAGIFLGALKKLQTKAMSETIEAKANPPSTTIASGFGTKKKDTWGLLKKSAVRSKEKKTTYLSKSDTILERKSEEDDVSERRSRSASPNTGKTGRRSLKCTVEKIINERRRTKSLGQVPKKLKTVDVNAWEFPDIVEQRIIRKYDSVDDLSPEYSDLPFVKKLQILNERQAEIDAIRSASLDVPDRSPQEDSTLIRSQSEASAIQLPNTPIPPIELNFRKTNDFIRRSETIMERSQFSENSPLVSPESNETLERRHLKSILKKLSAEEFEEGSPRKVSKEEMKNLLRAPTVQGYAARHSKLAKSVTFDNESLSSPPQMISPRRSPPPIAQSSRLNQNFYNTSSTSDGSLGRCIHRMRSDDVFKGVVTGIKQVMHGYLDDMEFQYEMKIQSLENEIRKRDKIINSLENKLRVAQGAEGAAGVTVSDSIEEISGAAFMRSDSVETVLDACRSSYMEAQGQGYFFEDNDENMDDENAFRFVSPFSMRKHDQNEQIELKNFPLYENAENSMKRVLYDDESRRKEFVSVEIDEEDSDESRNNDWEVEMLVRELDKRNNYAQESLNEIQAEITTLQKVFDNTNINKLSQTDYRVLQTIVSDSDRKIASLSQLSRFSDADEAFKFFRERKAFSLDSTSQIPFNCRWRNESTPKTRYSLPTLSSTSISSSSEDQQTIILSGSNDSVFEYDTQQPSCSHHTTAIRRSATMLSSGHYSQAVSITANLKETEENEDDQ